MQTPLTDRLTYIKRLLAGNLHVPARDVWWLVHEIDRLDMELASHQIRARESCGCGAWSP